MSHLAIKNFYLKAIFDKFNETLILFPSFKKMHKITSNFVEQLSELKFIKILIYNEIPHHLVLSLTAPKNRQQD